MHTALSFKVPENQKIHGEASRIECKSYRTLEHEIGTHKNPGLTSRLLQAIYL